MRKPFRALVPVLVFSGVFLLGQEGFDFEGNYSDAKRLAPQTSQNHDFTFLRLMYNGRIPHYLKNWYTDYPTGDSNLECVLKRLTYMDISPETRVLPLTDPNLFQYPMVYSSEAGQMVISNADARILREYLMRGGFWMVDDFWGTFEWNSFEHELKKVFPDREIVDIPLSHPIFHVFNDIDERMQVPNVSYAYNPGTPTWEQDGYEPVVRGIFDGNGRLLVFINHNTDLMDASEWADDPLYPHKFSAYSYKIFSNAVVYALSH